MKRKKQLVKILIASTRIYMARNKFAWFHDTFIKAYQLLLNTFLTNLHITHMLLK